MTDIHEEQSNFERSSMLFQRKSGRSLSFFDFPADLIALMRPFLIVAVWILQCWVFGAVQFPTIAKEWHRV
jgi:hypothetical protein